MIQRHFLLFALPAAVFAAPVAPSSFESLSAQYESVVRPVLKEYCLDCHSADLQKGDLNLERFTSLEEAWKDPGVWERVLEQIGSGEMPPEKKPQPSAGQRQSLSSWVSATLDAIALEDAGDPGPVVLRRLSNAEYNYTIQDLTGLAIEPTREFPVDGAAGEGFMNAGNALTMSPALLGKYLDAAKQVARHVVLLPDGIDFSPGVTPRDWTDERLHAIRQLYHAHTSGDGDVSSLDRWSGDPMIAAKSDGRVDLVRYFRPLLHHRQRLLDDPASIAAIARESGLNAKYAGLIAVMLAGDTPDSFLLNQVREAWRKASPEEAPRIVAGIRAWQARLWKFQPVGHFGLIRPWQSPVDPIEGTREIRLKLEPADAGKMVVKLAARSAGEPGGFVEWRNPRILRPGKPPLPLRDLRAVAHLLEEERQRTLRATPRYLSAADEARSQDNPDVEALAAARGLSPGMLRSWLAYLGVLNETTVSIKDYLETQVRAAAGYAFVNAWNYQGNGDLSIVANSSDDEVRIPGTLRGHRIAVHPRPERGVAAGWLSPVAGSITIAASIIDAHSNCGNGVTWSIERRQGDRRQLLRSGNVDLGQRARVDPFSLTVRKGDLLSLVISARDNNHVCDLTEVDLTIAETTGEKRQWSLAGDCADDILAGNPHSDRHGNAAVWHYYCQPAGAASARPPIPPDSLLGRWMDTTDEAAAARLAERIAGLLTHPLATDAPAADAAIHRELTSLNGPLFGSIVPANDDVTPEELAGTGYGLDPSLFGKHPDGTVADGGALILPAPGVLDFRLPASLVAGGEFVVTGSLHASSAEGAVLQLEAASGEGEPLEEGLSAISPLMARPESRGVDRIRKAYDDFRSLFPASMCHARIVPVDEVVTLVLFHREDDHLARLMLSEEEKARLDRLWEELRFVSQDALTMVAGYAQLWQYATQDSDPKKIEPLEAPIKERAARFRKTLLAAEPRHLDAVIAFADTAWRRPLTSTEERKLRALYGSLRAEGIAHDVAIRLTLARVLASPSFLYRIERPGQGAGPVRVSGLELATRLSYFLWSSLPDPSLRQAAKAGALSQSKEIVAHLHRMLDDTRTRRLAIEFGCQWLHVRGFDQHDEKSERHFPEFAGLRDDMYEESIRFFQSFFRHDESILSLLNASHTFLNGSLARHYGISDVTGEQWRRVDGVNEYSRGGILAQASILARQSGASRTSPILRGNWISETLLGDRLPRPPKDVPVLPDTVPEGLTERQLIERHSSDPACAKCHARIDPYGFTLESFDAIGRLRSEGIDTRTTLPDGTVLEGWRGMKEYLLTRQREAFLRQFCRKLLGYALGRGVQLSDKPLLDDMMRKLDREDYRVSVVLEAIVTSPQFRRIRGAER